MTDHQEKRMGIAEIIYEQVKALPEPLAREVFDFVVFLRDRSRGDATSWMRKRSRLHRYGRMRTIKRGIVFEGALWC
jgi:hypothetical protein